MVRRNRWARQIVKLYRKNVWTISSKCFVKFRRRFRRTFRRTFVEWPVNFRRMAFEISSNHVRNFVESPLLLKFRRITFDMSSNYFWNFVELPLESRLGTVEGNQESTEPILYNNSPQVTAIESPYDHQAPLRYQVVEIRRRAWYVWTSCFVHWSSCHL